MNDQMLPENDKDLQLARRIGKLLDNKQLSAESLGQGEFEQALGQLKQVESSNMANNSDLSNQMWEVISGATQPASTSKGTEAKIFTLNASFYRIAVAASVLLAVVIGWLILQPTSTPTLVAEAGNEINVFRLEDGTAITLRPNSSLYEVQQASNETRYSIDGEAYFEVTHNPERTFIVEAGVAQVAVLGTSFNVTNRDTLISVYLEEGSIALTHSGTQSREILSPGQVGTLSTASNIVVLETETNEEYLDWLNDTIYFSQKNFADIIAELEFHFSVVIELPEELIDDTASGSLSLESLDAALEKLSVIMGGGRFEQISSNRYTFESDN